jgi:hypothetical protein
MAMYKPKPRSSVGFLELHLLFEGEGHSISANVEHVIYFLIGAVVLEAKKRSRHRHAPASGSFATHYQNPMDVAAPQRRSISEVSPALRRSRSMTTNGWVWTLFGKGGKVVAGIDQNDFFDGDRGRAKAQQPELDSAVHIHPLFREPHWHGEARALLTRPKYDTVMSSRLVAFVRWYL